MNFAKFLGTPFLQNISARLLVTGIFEDNNNDLLTTAEQLSIVITLQM